MIRVLDGGAHEKGEGQKYLDFLHHFCNKALRPDLYTNVSRWQSVVAFYALPYDPLLYCSTPRVLVSFLHANSTSLVLALFIIYPLTTCLLYTYLTSESEF